MTSLFLVSARAALHISAPLAQGLEGAPRHVSPLPSPRFGERGWG